MSSSRFQGYTESNGRVRFRQVDAVPADRANHRGMIVTASAVNVMHKVDTGQARVMNDGIAFEEATGLLLTGDGTQTPLQVVKGGLLADARGAVVIANQTPDVVHQGVGLANDGSLCIAIVGAPPTPVASAGGPYIGAPGVNVQFDGSASTAGSGATITQYDWDFGEGAGFQNNLGATPSHTYASEAVFTVQLRVTNSFTEQDIDTTSADIAATPSEFLGSCLDAWPVDGGYESCSLFAYQDGATVRWFNYAYLGGTHVLQELTGVCDTLSKTGSWEIALNDAGARTTSDTASNAVGKQQTGAPRVFFDNNTLSLYVAQKHPSNASNCQFRELTYNQANNRWLITNDWQTESWLVTAAKFTVIADDRGRMLVFYSDSVNGLRMRYGNFVTGWTTPVTLDASAISGNFGNVAAHVFGTYGTDQSVGVCWYTPPQTLKFAEIAVPVNAADYATLGNWTISDVDATLLEDDHLSLRTWGKHLVIATKKGSPPDEVFMYWRPEGESVWVKEQINAVQTASRPNLVIDSRNQKIIAFFGATLAGDNKIYRRVFDMTSRTWDGEETLYAEAAGINASTAIAPFFPVNRDTGYIGAAREGVWSQSPV